MHDDARSGQQKKERQRTSVKRVRKKRGELRSKTKDATDLRKNKIRLEKQ